jgi:long-chain acyl-CoA synthetase
VLGERVTAFIVPRADAALPTPEALAAFGGGRLAAYKLPDLVIAATELPRTETGKIRKAVLKARLREAAAGAASAEPKGTEAAV